MACAEIEFNASDANNDGELERAEFDDNHQDHHSECGINSTKLPVAAV